MRRWVQSVSKQGLRRTARPAPRERAAQPPRIPTRVTSSLASFTDWRWCTGRHKNCVALRPPCGLYNHRPLLASDDFQGPRGLKQKRKLSPGPDASGRKPDPVTRARHTYDPSNLSRGKDSGQSEHRPRNHYRVPFRHCIPSWAFKNEHRAPGRIQPRARQSAEGRRAHRTRTGRRRGHCRTLHDKDRPFWPPPRGSLANPGRSSRFDPREDAASAQFSAFPALGAHRTQEVYPWAKAWLTHVQLMLTWNPSPHQPTRFSLDYLLLPPRSAPAVAPGRPAPVPSSLAAATLLLAGASIGVNQRQCPGGRVSGERLSAIPF